MKVNLEKTRQATLAAASTVAGCMPSFPCASSSLLHVLCHPRTPMTMRAARGRQCSAGISSCAFVGQAMAFQSAFIYAYLANPSIKPVIRVGFGYLHYYKIQYISRQVRFPTYRYCCLPKAWLGEILVSEFYSLTLPYLLRGTT